MGPVELQAGAEPVGGTLDLVDATSERLFVDFARTRDALLLEQLLQRHLPHARALARRILSDDADADDALQEALVRLVQTSGRYDGSIRFAAWLGQLVRFAAISRRRSRTERLQRERPIDHGAEPASPAASDGDERTAAIRAAVARLPEQFRAPIELHYYGELSLKETANALGLTEDAAAQRISRARERLRSYLGSGGRAVALALLMDQLAATAASASVASPSSAGAASGTTGTAASAAAMARLAIDRAAREPVASSAGWAVRPWRGPLIGIAAVVAVIVGAALLLGRGTDAGSDAGIVPAGDARTGGSAENTASFAAPTAADRDVAPAATVVTPPVRTLKRRHWTFDGPTVDGVTASVGSWRHEADVVSGDGALVIDDARFAATLDLGGFELPLRVTMQARPRLPISPQGDYHVAVLPRSVELALLRNVGSTRRTVDELPTDLGPVTAYISADAIDHWDGDRRQSLIFYRRLQPAAGWSLLAVGRWQIDDLLIEEIDAASLPDVQPYRAALAALPEARRTGKVELPGVVGDDPQAPVTAKFTSFIDTGEF